VRVALRESLRISAKEECLPKTKKMSSAFSQRLSTSGHPESTFDSSSLDYESQLGAGISLPYNGRMSSFDFAPVLANRIVSVITIDRAEDAEPLTQALLDGGLNALEVTFRSPA
jgi:hypothetical protein